MAALFALTSVTGLEACADGRNKADSEECEEDSDCSAGEICNDESECVPVEVGVGGFGGSLLGDAGGSPLNGAGGKTEGPGPSSSSTMNGGAGASGPPACDELGTFEDCAECLSGKNPAGVETLLKLQYNACACTPGAACTALCDTGGANDVCSAPGIVDLETEPSSACGNCMTGLNGTEPCVATFFNTCASDPACYSFMSALDECPGPT